MDDDDSEKSDEEEDKERNGTDSTISQPVLTRQRKYATSEYTVCRSNAFRGSQDNLNNAQLNSPEEDEQDRTLTESLQKKRNDLLSLVDSSPTHETPSSHPPIPRVPCPVSPNEVKLDGVCDISLAVANIPLNLHSTPAGTMTEPRDRPQRRRRNPTDYKAFHLRGEF